MQVTVSPETAGQYQGDAVVVGVLQKSLLSGPAAEANAALQGQIGQLMDAGEIRGRGGEVTVLHTTGRLPAARVAVMGLGEVSQLDVFVLRRALGATVRQLRDKGCRRVGVALPTEAPLTLRADALVRAVIEAAYVGLYRSEECKTEVGLPSELDELTLLSLPESELGLARGVAEAARQAGEATNYARTLVNLPANEVTPARLAQEAAQIAAETGMTLRVLEVEELRQMGMGAIVGVGQGSVNTPKLIVLEHRKGRHERPLLAFIGKGITFDSGGISLKPPLDMHIMKSDMAGGAAVLAAMRTIARRELPINVLGLVPVAENLPSATASRPGDVVRTYSGKTVEIISTDAEGRMVLADALTYARELGATHMVDIATLTGACIIALGHVAAAALGADSELVEAVLEAGEQAGERLWRLPLFPEYKKQLDSTVADLKNVGGRPAGVITAALFLKEFAGDVSWVHLDIAGTAYSESSQPHEVEGGTGAGTRILVALAERFGGGSP